MKNILKDLNQEAGIKGSMVITPDGMMVASALVANLEEDVVAAIVSSLLVAVKRALARIKAPDGLNSCILYANNGKIMFYDMGKAFLVVVADMDLNMDNSIIAIKSAIYRIQNRRVA